MIKVKSDFIFSWNAWILLLVTYSAIEIPFGIVQHYKSPVLIHIINALVTISFTIDFIIRYRINKSLKTKYRTGWLIVDLLSAIPFDLLLLTGAGSITLAVFRSLRLLKVLRVFSFKPLWEYRINVNSSVIRLLFFFYFMLICMHWIACGWLIIRIHPEGADMIHEYVKAFYWSTTTITTIGYGDITPDQTRVIEILYTIGVQFVGAVAFSYTIGNIAIMLTSMDLAKTRHTERVDRVDTFMKSKKMPKHLQERVHHYYDYLWESRQGYDDATILSELPVSFQYEFATVLNREILKKVPIFKDADPNLLKELAICLKPVIYTPGDPICTYGEVGDKMFFINKGFVEVVSQNGKEVYATLKAGDFFGEIALLLKQPRNATIRSVEYCDLYYLNKESFDRVASNYSDFEKSIQRMAEERISKLT